MSNIKAGMIGYLKTTEEPVFILELRNATIKRSGLSGFEAVARRPIAGENGIKHEVEFFAVEELETIEEAQNRKISEMSELKARFANSKEVETPGIKLFGTN